MACKQGALLQLNPVSRMSAVPFPDDDAIDPSIQCNRCEAICCRLTVLVMPDDPTPEYWIDHDELGMEVMRRLDDGWCAALDRDAMCCSIYSLRPQICRDFDMGGRDCRSERANSRGIAITVR